MTTPILEKLEWLFYAPTQKSKAISSCATFNPVSAAGSGDPWQSSTTPSADPNKRTLILTGDFFQGEIADFFALVEWLRCAGFEIRLCLFDAATQQNIFPLFRGNIDISRLSQLAPFDKKTDHDTLAQEEGVSYDRAVVLDHAKFTQLAHCLGEKQGVPGNNAISTATTLQFYHAPAEITNGYILASCMTGKSEGEALELISHYRRKEKKLNFAQLIACVEASSSAKVALQLYSLYGKELEKGSEEARYFEACPAELQTIFFKSHNEFIEEGRSLALYLKIYPAEAKMLIQVHGNKIQDGWQLSLCLKACPAEAKMLIQEYGNKIQDGWQLFLCLQACPAEAKMLIQEHVNKIQKGSELVSCLQACPAEAKMLIQEHGNKIRKGSELVDCLKVCPAEATTLFQIYGNEIKDGYDLAAHLMAYPEKAKTYIQQHGNKIKNGEELVACFEVCPAEAKTLVQAYDDDLIDGHALPVYISVYPEKADMLIQAHGRKITYLIPLHKCLIRFPERAEIFCQTHTIDWGSLRDYINMWPAGLALALKRYPDKISTLFLERLFETPNLPSLERYFSSQTLDRFYRKPDIYSIAEQETIENVTCLYVGSINKYTANEIIAYIQIYSLPNLSILEVANCEEDAIPDLERILEALQERKLHLLLPHSLQQKEVRLREKFAHSYAEHEKYAVQDNKEVFASPASVKTYSQKLDVALNGLSSKFETGNPGKSTFNVVSAGEILNGNTYQAPPRIRTGIIDLDLANFTQSYAQPGPLKPEKIADLKKEKFEKLVKQASNAPYGVYAKFTQTLVAGQPTRLLSIDAAEKLLAMHHGQPTAGNTVRIGKGKDDFYYATATETCDLQYVVQAYPSELKRFDIQDPIQRILKAYTENPKYRACVDANYHVPPIGKDPAAWWEKLYEDCAGSCRHRVGAVYAKILRELSSQDPDIKKKVRIVDIDNNHVCLEVRDAGNHWWQVDLGGAESAHTYAPAGTKYVAAPDATPSPSTQKKRKETEEKRTPEEEKILRKWREKTALIPIQTVKDFLDNTVMHTTHRKILCATSTVEKLHAQANFLLQHACAQQRPIFYLDHPDKIDLGIEQIVLNASGEPQLLKYSLLEIFLKQAHQAQNPPLLLINWEAFSPKKRLQLNTILDKKRSLCGIPIPKEVQIVGLCAQIPEDPSFLSRHTARLDTMYCDIPAPPARATENANAEQPEKVTIDLEGIANWEEKLFGKIVQTEKGMRWQKSTFLSRLEDGIPKKIEIINASNHAACVYAINQALALGKFSYHGLDMAWPENMEIVCNTAPFDFSQFEPPSVERQIARSDAPIGMHVVNTHRFDFLLVGKVIFDREGKGSYEEIPGLIEKNKNRTLHLFITSKLTEAQWYCMLFEAQKHQVKLDLSLAPNVVLPASLKEEKLQPQEEKVDCPENIVCITAQADILEKSIRSMSLSPLVLHVEDYHFGDLFFTLDYKKTANGFEDFKVKKSAVLEALANGRDVILRGAFSEALLAELQPILLGQPVQLPTGECIRLKGKLICLIEPKAEIDVSWLSYSLLRDPAELVQSAADLMTVSHQNPGKIVYDESRNVVSEKIEEEAWEEVFSETEEKGIKLKIIPESPEPMCTREAGILAEEFIRARIAALLAALQDSSLLQIISKSGAGKSTALAWMKANGICAVYNELSSFEAWAMDSRTEVKILFIDESNIEDLHLTLFEPLKPGGSREILYKGKLYPVDPYHKVVFACNPLHYGGGRKQQKLFEDGSIPEMHFSDFPDAYIQEKILKPILLSAGMDEKACLAFCEPLIAYYKKNREGDKKYTVRELQEYTWQMCRQRKERELLYASEPLEIKEEEGQKTFSCTSGNAYLLSLLETFVAIRKEAREKNDDLHGIGLNGALIEGKPATGKSESVRYALEKAGYQIVYDDVYAVAAGNLFLCYKINAYLPLEEKERIIIKAFEEGNAIWIDELNGCIDDGLEKILNAALTGEHPKTKEKSKVPGFMAFFTANSAGLVGRDLIGAALCHRCNMLSTADHQLKDVEIIFAEKFPHFPEDIREEMAQEFILLQTQGEDLRSYLERMEPEGLQKAPPIAPPPAISFPWGLHVNDNAQSAAAMGAVAC